LLPILLETLDSVVGKKTSVDTPELFSEMKIV